MMYKIPVFHKKQGLHVSGGKRGDGSQKTELISFFDLLLYNYIYIYYYYYYYYYII